MVLEESAARISGLVAFEASLIMRLCKSSVLFDAQSFSAVVGPNGSGKSNVIDAMLFVFGKRAKQVSTMPQFLFSRVLAFHVPLLFCSLREAWTMELVHSTDSRCTIIGYEFMKLADEAK